MKVTIEIQCDNAAFGEDPEREIGLALEDLGSNLRRGYMNLTAYAMGAKAHIRNEDGLEIGTLEVSALPCEVSE